MFCVQLRLFNDETTKVLIKVDTPTVQSVSLRMNLKKCIFLKLPLLHYIKETVLILYHNLCTWDELSCRFKHVHKTGFFFNLNFVFCFVLLLFKKKGSFKQNNLYLYKMTAVLN